MLRVIFAAISLIVALCGPCFHAWSNEIYLEGEGETAVTSLIEKLPNRLRTERNLVADLKSLFLGYEGYCTGMKITEDGRILIIMHDKTRVLYDDRIEKSFEDKLDRPDLEDMLSQVYIPGKVAGELPDEYDPGRFRVSAFFKSVYGRTPADVKADLISIKFCGTRVQFNTQNGAAKALEKVSSELTELLKQSPNLSAYVFPLAGTFSWRNVAGTSRLSPHSFGTAIDLSTKHGAYWRWKKPGTSIAALRDSYPNEIVAIFEKHGFIWGGKWFHYDFMHFEYRPELFLKARFLRLDR